MRRQTSRLTIQLPKPVHAQFKKLAADKGQSMRGLIIGSILEQIAQTGEECPYPHIPNARTRKAIKEALSGKNLVECENASDFYEGLFDPSTNAQE